MRTIMLVDMDCFFAACEELRKPGLSGKPTVVFSGTDKDAPRAVVMTCNYEARKHKIHSGMSLAVARRLYPKAEYLPEDFDYYEEMSAKAMAILKTFSNNIEQVSIDEAFLDVTKEAENQDPKEYAKQIKERIKQVLGLKCTIGISSNKLIAKMACTAGKPDGIKEVREAEAEAFLAPMKVGKLYGVGRKTEEKLKEMGYETIGQLAHANQMALIQTFGVFGAEIYLHSKGIDESPVKQMDEIKSIGREYTFQQDTNDAKEIRDAISRLSKDIHAELLKKKFTFKTITLKMRYEDFTEHLKSKSLRYFSTNKEDITTSAFALMDLNLEDKKIRKIGVRVSTLGNDKGQVKLGTYFA